MTTAAPLRIRLAGVGSYLPDRRVTSRELAARFGVDADWVERATGVIERRYAGSEDTTVGMAAAAARAALDRAELLPQDLDAIVGASASRQQLIPCTAAFIQRALQCPEGRSFCFDVDATCLSWLVGLHLVSQIVASGRTRTALLVSSEMASRSLDPTQPESAVLFGDAAAAARLIGQASPMSRAV